jgi:ATP-dependent Lon protease
LKLLHPGVLEGDGPSPEELDEYMEYAVEGRRRVKEQMNKRKPDDEFASINLTYFNSRGEEVEVWCPESKRAAATQNPKRKTLPGMPEWKPETRGGAFRLKKVAHEVDEAQPAQASDNAPPVAQPRQVDESAPPEPSIQEAAEMAVAGDRKPQLESRHFKVHHGETGHTYESLFGEYLIGVRHVSIEDPYIRATHQIANFVRFCELCVKVGTVRNIDLLTSVESPSQKAESAEKLEMLKQSLLENDVELTFHFSPVIHDRQIKLDNGWVIKIGRGFDIYQPPENWYSIGANDYELRPCRETMVDIFERGK